MRIDANPTKEFFIDMLTRDIPLNRAILDLIDNSIDGAKGLRKNSNYNDLWIKIKISPNEFVIEDNCGGFSLKTATEYAFRFGRPTNKAFVKESIGRFGVGMKRSLFKMGRSFSIETKKGKDHFKVYVDVAQWTEQTEWEFNYQDLTTTGGELSIEGTLIKIIDLYETVSNDFSSNEFINELKKEMSLALNFNIEKHLQIKINNKKIEKKNIEFLTSKTSLPSLKTIELQHNNKEVVVKIIAGLGEPKPSEAGWYIYCNDRLVLDADKSYVTGWKESKDDATNVLKYHNQYAMFRGVVLYYCDDSKALPMTTTKTGIDTGHSSFKQIRPDMLTAMKQVTGFLGKIDKKEIRDDFVANSKLTPVYRIINDDHSNYKEQFKAPTISKLNSSINEFTSISYKKETIMVEKVKAFLNAATNKEIGEKTFDFFVKIKEID